MNNINYQRLLTRLLLFIFVILAAFGTMPLFIITVVFIAVGLVSRTWFLGHEPKRQRLFLMALYLVLMILEIVFLTTGLFPDGAVGHPLRRVIATIILPLPFLVKRVLPSRGAGSLDLPSLSDLTTISFDQLRQGQTELRQALQQAQKVQQVLSVDNMQAIFGDLHRHSATRYINDGSLTPAYFEQAQETLTDPYLYIVISNTGSPASELIALFTQKQFNHASLSFDRRLKTIISYNGGDRVYPPGLNPEMLAAFHQKDDASVLIYRLAVTPQQKAKVLDTIRRINETGSAYNILGLVTKHSLRRNIMFCSQFVYKMLQIGDVAYFDKAPGNVQPTDFVEADYYRKLEFVEEIKF